MGRERGVEVNSKVERVEKRVAKEKAAASS
jgi:hypothetical protein